MVLAGRQAFAIRYFDCLAAVGGIVPLVLLVDNHFFVAHPNDTPGSARPEIGVLERCVDRVDARGNLCRRIDRAAVVGHLGTEQQVVEGFCFLLRATRKRIVGGHDRGAAA